MKRWWSAALLGAAGCLTEPGPVQVMTVELTVTPALTPDHYAVVVHVNHFDVEDHVRVQITVGPDDGSAPDERFTSWFLQGEWFYWETGALEPETPYHVRVRAFGDSGYDPRAEQHWRTTSAP